VNIVNYSITTEVILMFPGDSLKRQFEWLVQRRPQWNMLMSRERSLPEMRKLLGNADAAVIDATEDHAMAIDAYLQATARLGSESVVVYAEVMDEELELFVRCRGSMVILGPLHDQYWMDFFDIVTSRKQNSILPFSCKQRGTSAA
jgi:hypothetical protein